MRLILAALAGLLGAALGFGGGLALGGPLAAALSISSFEGGAGYFALLVGVAGGLIGFFGATALALRYLGGYRSFGAIAGRIAMIVLALGILTAIGIQIRLASVEHFDGASPQMRFEIRLPANAPVVDRKAIDIEMQAGSQRSGAVLNDAWLRHDGDRPVIGGLVPLYTRTASRILVVSLPDAPQLLFNIRLAATPKPTKAYGDWQRVNNVDDGKADSQPRKPTASEAYEIRYYVPE